MSTNAFLFSSFKISVKPESNSHRSQSQLIKTVQQFRAELLVYTYIYIYIYAYVYIYVFSQCPACPLAQPIKNKEIRVDNPTMGLRTMLRSFFVSPLQPTQLIKCFHPRHFSGGGAVAGRWRDGDGDHVPDAICRPSLASKTGRVTHTPGR